MHILPNHLVFHLGATRFQRTHKPTGGMVFTVAPPVWYYPRLGALQFPPPHKTVSALDPSMLVLFILNLFFISHPLTWWLLDGASIHGSRHFTQMPSHTRRTFNIVTPMSTHLMTTRRRCGLRRRHGDHSRASRWRRHRDHHGRLQNDSDEDIVWSISSCHNPNHFTSLMKDAISASLY